MQEAAIQHTQIVHGVQREVAQAAILRWPGRVRTVAKLLDRAAAELEAELEQLRWRGVDPDAALDSMVLG